MSPAPITCRPVRIVLAKPGLDGHDRGLKVVAMGLRDAGAEVIYLGLRVSARQIAAAAMAEDADAVGISVLSGAHLTIASQVLRALAAAHLDLPLAIGGTIPPRDAERLTKMGVAGVFPVGTPLPDSVASLLALAARASEGAGPR